MIRPLFLLLAGCSPYYPTPEEEAMPLPGTSLDSEFGMNDSVLIDSDECVDEKELNKICQGTWIPLNNSSQQALCVDFEESNQNEKYKFLQLMVDEVGFYQGLSLFDSNNDAGDDVLILGKEKNKLYLSHVDSGSYYESGLDLGKDGSYGVWGDFDSNGSTDLIIGGYRGVKVYFFDDKIIRDDFLLTDQPSQAGLFLEGGTVLVGTSEGLSVFKWNQEEENFLDETEGSVWSADAYEALDFVEADFNGDGHSDVYVAHGNNKDYVFLQGSDGTYALNWEDDSLIFDDEDEIRSSLEATVLPFPNLYNPPSLIVSHYESDPSFYSINEDGIYEDQAGELRFSGIAQITSVAPTYLNLDLPPVFFFGSRLSRDANSIYLPQRDYEDLYYSERTSLLGMGDLPKTVQATWLDVDGDSDRDLLVLGEEEVRLFINESVVYEICGEE